MSAPDTHRGWLIQENWAGAYEATHPDFDPTPVYADDDPSDTRHVSATTRAGVIDEIDAWFWREQGA